MKITLDYYYIDSIADHDSNDTEFDDSIEYPIDDDYDLSDEWFPWAWEKSEYEAIIKSLEGECNDYRKRYQKSRRSFC